MIPPRVEQELIFEYKPFAFNYFKAYARDLALGNRRNAFYLPVILKLLRISAISSGNARKPLLAGAHLTLNFSYVHSAFSGWNANARDSKNKALKFAPTAFWGSLLESATDKRAWPSRDCCTDIVHWSE